MVAQTHKGYYYAPHSYWPIVLCVALLFLTGGFACWINGVGLGKAATALGAIILAVGMFGWFGRIIVENVSGLYDRQVDDSFRWGMAWFIFSEVMFFGAFFGALFYSRWIGLSRLDAADLLWPGFTPSWPSLGPGLKGEIAPVDPWGIPALNTLLLLSSGATLTWAHWGLKAQKQGQTLLGLALTIILGATFLGFQAYEYMEAAFSIKSGIFGTTFFMLTGFHGMHVTVGTIMLVVAFLRAAKGHFTQENHFAFEATSWYWHFVDVVWLFLFVFVYWL